MTVSPADIPYTLPRIGDRITAVTAWWTNVFIVEVTMSKMFRAYQQGRHKHYARARWFNADTEGVKWIRGEHAPDSPESAALLAANALCRPR